MTSLKLPAPRITKRAAESARVLILDVERLKGEIVHDFWDLSEMKGRRFHPNEVTRWPRIICVAAQWYDKPREHIFHAEWGDGGKEAMLKATWDLYDQANIVVGHNLRSFDTKHLKGEWLQMGLPSPRPWQTVDTLAVARSEFHFESNTLDALCKRLGVAAKVDTYDAQCAERAVNGSTPDQKRLERYNRGDIKATRALYDALRPWIKGHPNLGLWANDGTACPNCGSHTFEQMGDVTTPQSRYGGLRCASCKAPLRRTHLKRRIDVRTAR